MNRRQFIETGLMAGTGLYAARRAQAQAAKKTSDEMNIALIGTGAQGRVLMNSLLQIPNVRFRAVCDIWEFNRQYGQRYVQKYKHEAKAYEDYRELLDKEAKNLDAVVIATPDFVHHEHTIACLKAGLNVYCEKMMSNNIEKARSMVKAMKETGKLLQIGHQRRSNPRYQHALNNLIKQGKICGRFTAANAQWNRAVTEPYGWPEKYTIPPETLKKYGYTNMQEFRNWRWFRKFGGGPISDLGAHQIDIFNWFFECSPKSVIAGGGKDFYKEYEWYDNVMAIYEYDLPTGPARAFYQVLTTTSTGGYFEQFMGTEGTIKMSENPKNSKVYREPHAEKEWDEWVKKGWLSQKAPEQKAATSGPTDVRETGDVMAFDIPVPMDKPYHQPHLENFFDAVRGKCKLNCPADEAFHSEVAVFKVNTAVESKQMYCFKPEDFAV